MKNLYSRLKDLKNIKSAFSRETSQNEPETAKLRETSQRRANTEENPSSHKTESAGARGPREKQNSFQVNQASSKPSASKPSASKPSASKPSASNLEKSDSTPAFAEIGLNSRLVKALLEEGYSHPTPIQARAIPDLLKGRDLLGLAQTGTGKTAAFALPVLQRLFIEPSEHATSVPQSRRSQIRCLVLAPTRELAIQVRDSFVTYGRHIRFRSEVILGGVGMNPQIESLRRGVDVLVATPGRLLDLHSQGHVKLDQVEVFVLDEADRMLDMGFLKDVTRIIKLLPQKRQNVLFSATMPSEIQDLASGLLRNPVHVEVAARSTTAQKISQSVYFVAQKMKISLLLELIRDEKPGRMIVFTRMKHMANKVAAALSENEIPAEAIHGNKSQSARQRALENFRDGTTCVLVASDLAARGIDIDKVTHVVNFDLPNVAETYVHRIGRTARAGEEGQAIAFCGEDELFYLRSIEKLINQKINVKEGTLSMSSAEVANLSQSKPPAAGQGRGGRGGRPQNSQRSSRPSRPNRS